MLLLRQMAQVLPTKCCPPHPCQAAFQGEMLIGVLHTSTVGQVLSSPPLS